MTETREGEDTQILEKKRLRRAVQGSGRTKKNQAAASMSGRLENVAAKLKLLSNLMEME